MKGEGRTENQAATTGDEEGASNDRLISVAGGKQIRGSEVDGGQQHEGRHREDRKDDQQDRGKSHQAEIGNECDALSKDSLRTVETVLNQPVHRAMRHAEDEQGYEKRKPGITGGEGRINERQNDPDDLMPTLRRIEERLEELRRRLPAQQG